jgi:DNA-binding NarL/FixJ family response regulator
VAIRLVLGEDSYLVREGVSRLLEAIDGLELLAACDSYSSLLAAVEAHEPDVVLTDIRMPPTFTDEGLRIATWVREHRPKMGVVVLSQFVEPAYAVALLEKGSSGRAYLLKERVSDVSDLESAVRAVAAGGSVIDPKVVEALVAARARKESPLDGLTTRERDVLGRVAEGKNNAAIATALFLTERAVEKHINSIFSKLGLSDEVDVNRRVKAALMYLAG